MSAVTLLRTLAAVALLLALVLLTGLALALEDGDAGRALVCGGILAAGLALHPLVLALETALARRAAAPQAGPQTPWPVWVLAWRAEVPVSLRAFAWRMPWRAQAEPDHLPATGRGRRGVLLVHGYLCNRGLWRDWLARLRERGVPVVAVNLQPVLGRLEDTALAIEAAVRRLEACTGLPPVVVAHSMGGLALRHWWAGHGGDARLHRAVTLATPHQGTWLARFGLSANARQMQPGSPWLRELAAREPPERAARCTCVVAECDNVVFPAALALWPGAQLQMVAGAAHLDLLERPQAWLALERALA